MNSGRYHRLTLLPQISQAGQARLGTARVAIVGCGALGTVIADQLVRCGVGHVRLIDRDLVELTNLQRQVLFDERDVAEAMPKAQAAARRLRLVNSRVEIDPVIADVHGGNIDELLHGTFKAELVLDGTDNAETRYLLNDWAVKNNVPWVYGACVGVEGRVMEIVPHAGPCLRCLFPDPPAAGELPTCDTVGVLGQAAAITASLQAVKAMRILIGNAQQTDDDAQTNADASRVHQLISFDAWNGRFHTVDVSQAKRPDCPACGQHRFEFLDERRGDEAVSLCGRNAVQIRGRRIDDPAAVHERLKKIGVVEKTSFFIRCKLNPSAEAGGAGISLTLFSDGRVIIQGIADLGRARALYARYVGS